jgi:hypothetical protein
LEQAIALLLEPEDAENVIQLQRDLRTADLLAINVAEQVKGIRAVADHIGGTPTTAGSIAHAFANAVERGTVKL